MKTVYEQTVDKFYDYISARDEDDSTAWYEGYASALASHKLITEDEFDKLLELVNINVNSMMDDFCNQMVANLSTKQ